MLTMLLKDTKNIKKNCIQRDGCRHAVLYSSPRAINKDLIIQTFISFGIQQHKPLFKSKVVKIDEFAPNYPEIKNQYLVSHKKKFNIPEIKLGLAISSNYNNVILKPYISWAKTSKLGQFNDDKRTDDDTYSVKYRNSITLGMMLAIKI